MIKPSWVACGIVLFCAAVFVCASYGVMGLSLDLKVRPAELGALAISVYIAFFLQTYFESRRSDLRAEKDLLIEDYKDVVAALKSCREELEVCFYSGKMYPQATKKILTLLRHLANALDHMEVALRQSQCNCLLPEFAKIRDSYYRFKCASTGEGFPTNPVTDALYTLQSKIYKEMRAELQSLLFHVNRYQ